MQSHPEWVRGLKPFIISAQPLMLRSHPEWVRGLKPPLDENNNIVNEVAPRVGAWIETVAGQSSAPAYVSHPEWVRGLKQRFPYTLRYVVYVAPRVGAWIETLCLP